MRVHFAGQSWRWCYSRLRGNANGWTIYPKRTVIIHDRLPPQRRLEIELHEALHCLYPDLSEESVTNGAADLRRLLWRLGYRRTEA